MIEISELQKKRADNIIWNCAGDHSFRPDLRAFREDGTAELYLNCIIGAVRKHYDYPVLERLLRELQPYENSGIYESLIWLGLENAAYHRERDSRPVLRRLRVRYAEERLRESRRLFGAAASARTGPALSAETALYNAAESGHWKRVLDMDPALSGYETEFLNALEFSPALTAEEIVEQAERLLLHWFGIRPGEKIRIPLSKRLHQFGRKQQNASGTYREFGGKIFFHPENIYGGADASDGEQNSGLNTKLTAAELRAFMEEKFGRSVYSLQETARREKALCAGNHENCHLLFTDGIRPAEAEIRNGFEALSRQREAQQIRKNREFYQENIVRNRLVISRLTSNLRNNILLHLMPSEIRTDSGNLEPRLAWRAAVLGDDNVFTKREKDNIGNVSVDLLLDASTSQKYRQEIISSQGYIIAESLSACGLPCRVMSFCSMSGYTVLRIFRDYDRPRDNEKIFEYVSNGCNRDGLAIRAAHELIGSNDCEHRILIILSDVKPNDVIKLRHGAGEEPVPYDTAAGLEDTALEVRRARNDGISVLCIFTGEDENVPSARLVYDRDFVRIRSFDMLADTVAGLIRNQLRNL